MFVRLAFAVAVYSNPDILIVDEALAVGDAAFQAKCMARMNQIMKSGATVLFVTHDMNTVKRLCQRCIYLENGMKIMEGSAEELADIYLKKIRASMNDEHLKLEENRNDEVDTIKECSISKKDNEIYKNKQFIERTKMFKEGTGEIEFIDLKLLNEKGNETFSFSFNQNMRICIRLKVNTENMFTIAYHIRDDKNMELLGNSVLRELDTMIQGEKGDIFEINFVTPLPLIEGNYNITLVASKPVIENRTALFLSLIDNAGVFAVEENLENKLWDKVYLKNEVTYRKISV